MAGQPEHQAGARRASWPETVCSEVHGGTRIPNSAVYVYHSLEGFNYTLYTYRGHHAWTVHAAKTSHSTIQPSTTLVLCNKTWHAVNSVTRLSDLVRRLTSRHPNVPATQVLPLLLCIRAGSRPIQLALSERQGASSKSSVGSLRAGAGRCGPAGSSSRPGRPLQAALPTLKLPQGLWCVYKPCLCPAFDTCCHCCRRH